SSTSCPRPYRVEALCAEGPMPPGWRRAARLAALALLGGLRGARGLRAGGAALPLQASAAVAPGGASAAPPRKRGVFNFGAPAAGPGGAEAREVRRAPRTPEEAAADFGGAQGLCDYWGWPPLAPGARRPRIFYGTAGRGPWRTSTSCTSWRWQSLGSGAKDRVQVQVFACGTRASPPWRSWQTPMRTDPRPLWKAPCFSEGPCPDACPFPSPQKVSPFVSRIVAVDPKMTQQGHQRNVSLNMSSPRFRRFGDQLRRVELESPTGGKTLSQLSVAERSSLLRSGREPLNSAFVLEQWTRAQMEQGFKDSHGNWEMEEGDIVIVADSDEIPLRHFLAALQYCEVPSFKMVNLMLDQGMEHTLACRGAVVPLRSQVYEYFMDCPTKQPIWMRPNVALARCLMNGEMDFEDVRTSSRHRTSPPRKVAARHLHNVGMSLQDIVFKYGHYVEPRTEFLDSGLDVETNQEMMWRGCDPRAPELGPGSWYMSLRPSNDFIDPRNARGYCVEYEGLRRGLDLPFALLEERPELAGGLLWRGHAELRNPFAGRKGGTNYFHD
ncbi:unnamed protein product, partial [Prorocentrum cordatum]